jgi:hypothetical protein
LEHLIVPKGEVIDGQQRDAKVSSEERVVNDARELKDGNNILLKKPT